MTEGLGEAELFVYIEEVHIYWKNTIQQDGIIKKLKSDQNVRILN